MTELSNSSSQSKSMENNHKKIPRDDLRSIKYIVHSVKPKTAIVKCTVPNCTRSWYLSGSKSGFLLAAAESHGFAHWRKYHKEQNHLKAVWIDTDGIEHEGVEFCELCKAVSVVEWLKNE